MSEPIEKCIKCNKNTKNEDIINYNVPIIWGKDKDNNLIKKLEGGIHCLDCWKKVEKDYRWYAYGIGGDVHKGMGWRGMNNYCFDWKTNQWVSMESLPDSDVPISPNDKILNYWVGCFKCGRERQLKDDERGGVIIRCEKCHSGKVEIYPTSKNNNNNNNSRERERANSNSDCWIRGYN